jgi:uncharacterized protein
MMNAPSAGNEAKQVPRLEMLDALRGTALLGILFVNYSFFAMPEGSFGSYGDLRFPSQWDRCAQFLTDMFCDGKFILIFSFLFGWGFYSQIRSGDSQANRLRYFRRLLGLLLIGLLHASLLFYGDILVTYAILGVPLYWVRYWKPKTLLIAATFLWLLSVLGHLLLSAIPFSSDTSLDSYGETLRLHTQGSLSAIIMYRLETLVGVYIITPLLFMPQVFGMFLVGLAAAKEYETKGMDSIRQLAGVLLISFWLPALLGNLAYPWLSNLESENPLAFLRFLALGARGLFSPMLTLVYLSFAALLFRHSIGVRLAQILGGEGRSTLSLYIGESIVMGLLFNSYGLAWYGEVGPAQGIIICLITYLTLMFAMKLWLTFFRMGPLEWVLRCFTEWRWISIRPS